MRLAPASPSGSSCRQPSRMGSLVALAPVQGAWIPGPVGCPARQAPGMIRASGAGHRGVLQVQCGGTGVQLPGLRRRRRFPRR